MKHILAFCSLYFVTLLAYADVCPPPPALFSLNVAYWKSDGGQESPVRCVYTYRSHGGKQQYSESFTEKTYKEKDIRKHAEWHVDVKHSYYCPNLTADVNGCPFN